MSKLVLCSAVFVVGGCYQHVVIQPPSPTLTPAQRVAMFERYVPVKETLTATCTRNRAGVGDCLLDDMIDLAGGEQIHYPEDLLPAASPGGELARHVAAYQHADRMFDALSVLGYGAEALDEQHAAYHAFGHELAARLNVCVAGLAIVPCEASSPAAPPPLAPPGLIEPTPIN